MHRLSPTPPVWLLVLALPGAGCGAGQVWRLTERVADSPVAGSLSDAPPAVVLDTSLPLRADRIDVEPLLSVLAPYGPSAAAVAAELHFAPGPRPQHATLWLEQLTAAAPAPAQDEMSATVERYEADFEVDHFGDQVQLRFLGARQPAGFSSAGTDNGTTRWQGITIARLLGLTQTELHLDCQPAAGRDWTCRTTSGRLHFRGPTP